MLFVLIIVRAILFDDDGDGDDDDDDDDDALFSHQQDNRTFPLLRSPYTYFHTPFYMISLLYFTDQVVLLIICLGSTALPKGEKWMDVNYCRVAYKQTLEIVKGISSYDSSSL